MKDSKSISGRLSALSYLSVVAAITAAGIGLAMALRPSFGHTVLRLSGLETPRVAVADSFYMTRVQPLFTRHCAGCHGERMAKAALRLDSFDAAMRGGKYGAVVLASNAKDSELLFRMTLPPEDDRAMPPSGKEPMTKDEIAVVRLWITHGASGTLAAIKDAPRLVAPITIPQFDPEAAKKARAAHDALVITLQARFAGMIAYEARDSGMLEVNAALFGRGFGDGELAALAPLAGAIVRLDLSGSAVTDASLPLLAKMQSLRQLRLLDVPGMSGAVLQTLPNLKSLKSIAVNAPVPDENLKALRMRKVTIYRGSDG